MTLHNLFDFLLEQYSGFLPSAQIRWCTRELKIKPFEKYIKNDNIISHNFILKSLELLKKEEN